MFDPSQHEVRRFFCEAWRKRRENAPLTPLETIAADWAAAHPEYHEDLASAERAVAADYGPNTGRENPFLHLSMHLALSEQAAADQPPGIRAALARLAAVRGDPHAAAHEAMECLGEALWRAQREGRPPDTDAYLACLRLRCERAAR